MADERTEELRARVPSEDAERLRSRAKQEGRAVADLVRSAVAEYLGRQDAEDRVLAAIAKQGDRVSAMVARTFVAADMAMRLGRLTLLATATVERDMQPEPVEFVEEVCRDAETLAAVDLRGKGLRIIQPDDVYESALARAGGDASGE